LLLAAGFAPASPHRPLDDPALAAARRAVDLVLAAHEPFPAIAIDRHWQLVAANAGFTPLLAGVDPALLRPPVNVLRLSLHPDGAAPNIVNLGQWRAHIFPRLEEQIRATGDRVLIRLLDELRGYPGREDDEADNPYAGIAVPLILRTPMGELSFISTTTMFGTPVDITLAELAVESFLPADPQTLAALREMQAAASATAH
ncbi:MAG: transcriptional regulator, partial [Sphingomonadaceae bacterium]|nr:transcriptional regulator [Sphingomonadaceae bacterium]